MKKKYWMSWISDLDQPFELHWPWWQSGSDCNDRWIICAAIMAESEEAAWQILIDSHDEPDLATPERRFCNHKPDNWRPFCDRFPRADWMQWPEEAA